LQNNYPLVTIRIFLKQSDNSYYLNITQERFRNTPFSIFAEDNLYPSPYNYTWFIPLKCTFGRSLNDPEPFDDEFLIDQKNLIILLGDGKTKFEWIHCDQHFNGYYLMDYTAENWEILGQILKEQKYDVNQYSLILIRILIKFKNNFFY
jgi:hypothetical protein